MGSSFSKLGQSTISGAPNYYQPAPEYDELFASIAQSVDADERYAGLQSLKALFDADLPSRQFTAT